MSKNEVFKIQESFIKGYEDYKTPVFLVFDNHDNFIGRVGLFYTNDLDAIGIGYFVDNKFWGKGYVSEITKTLLD